ncbi:MAG TPA: chemotaxis protein CheW [Gemmatimonadaceae bacterium]|nr:chemotaxis protein CheW [Gemmatimonadaceae bacterium]
MTMTTEGAVSAAPETHTRLLLMRQGAEFFALELASALEALELPELTRLPGAPASLLGMTTIRGAVIPVFAASRVLDVDGKAGGDKVLVVVRDGDRQIGMVVDEVEDVIMADLTTIQQPMESMRGDGVVLGVVRSGSRLVALLDARAIVRIGVRALPGAE